MWGFSSLKDVLDVVMVPIALGLLALLIPRRWQNRQRDSETKTELVTEITELIMKTIMTVHLYNKSPIRRSDSDNGEEQELDRIYKDWVVDNCVVGTKLHAYFPNPNKKEKQIHLRWGRFSDQITDFYKSSWKEGSEKREMTLDEEKKSVGKRE